MTIKVLLSGQSNALGRGTGGPAWSGISSDVRVWNNVNPLGAQGSAFVSATAARAAGTFENTDRDNFSVWFCDTLARTRFDTVDLTVVARGASPIAYWDPAETTYPMLDACIDVWAATGQGPADVFLWHQGEGDQANPDRGAWVTAFKALVANLRSAGVLAPSAIVIPAGLATSTMEKVSFNDEAVLPAAAAVRGWYASSFALPSDGVHFTGPALYDLGAQRCYAAYVAGASLTT
jgi:hypothetical protein